MRLLGVGVLFLTGMTLANVCSHRPLTFERTYGGNRADCGFSVAPTSDRGCIVVGSSASFGAGLTDVYLIKLDANGDTLWSRTFGGADYDIGYAVEQTADGGYIIAGDTRSFGAGGYDAWLIRTDARGDTLWTRTFGGPGDDGARSVVQTEDGGYLLAGCTESVGAGQGDVFLVRTDADGRELWSRTYGGTGLDQAFSVQQTADKGFVVAGLTQSFGAGEDDVYLIKTNTRGDTLWTRTFGGDDDDFGYSVRQTADGGYIVAGLTESFGAGGEDVYLIRTDARGDTLLCRENRGQSLGAPASDVPRAPQGRAARYSPRFPGTLWTRTFGGPNSDEAHAVEVTADGGFVVAGSTYSFGAGSFDGYLLRAGPRGDLLWTKTLGGPGDDGAWSVAKAVGGGFLVAGYRSSAAGDRDVFLVKADSAGNVLADTTKVH